MIIRKITSLLLSAAIAGGVLLYSPFQAMGAEVGDPVSLDPTDGVSTVIKYENGDQQTRRGMLLTAESEQNSALESVSEYEIVVKGTPAVRVEPHEAQSVGQEPGNAYYSVSFSIPGTSKEGFLTGLSAERIDSVQAKVVNGILNEAQTGDFKPRTTCLTFLPKTSMTRAISSETASSGFSTERWEAIIRTKHCPRTMEAAAAICPTILPRTI